MFHVNVNVLPTRPKAEDQQPPPAKKAKSGLDKCQRCKIEFADADELVLHESKPKCKSIECNICKKMFANARTHQTHDCKSHVVEGDNEGLIVLKIEKKAIGDQPLACGQERTRVDDQFEL